MSELLLIDDDTELCDLLSRWLSQEGFQVSACHDAHSARALLAQCSQLGATLGHLVVKFLNILFWRLILF